MNYESNPTIHSGISSLEREVILKNFEERDTQRRDRSKLVFWACVGSFALITSGAFIYHNYHESIQSVVGYCFGE